MKLSTATFALRLALDIVSCSSLFAAGGDAGAQPAGAAPPWGKLEEEFRIALQRPDIAKMREIFNAGIDVNARDESGNTVLHTAVNFRSEIEIIRLILDKGADINAQDSEGHTPLLVALRRGHYRHESKGEKLYAIAQLLLSRGASAKIEGKNAELPVRAAMDPLNLPLIRLLVKHGAALPDDGLDHALRFEQVELVKYFMEAATPAMLAYKSVDGAGVLHSAAQHPRTVFAMEWVVRKGANINSVNKDGETPFARAAFHGNIPAMAWLAANKADTRTVDSEGWMPLHFAALHGRHEGLRWLVERGADITARDKMGQTALEIAIDTKDFAYYEDAMKLEVVTMLGGTAADIARGRFSVNPLYDAVFRDDLRQVERLLTAGADPNRKTADGHLPLGMALWKLGASETRAQREFAEKAIPLLLRHGANPKLKMDDGKTPEQRARELRIGDVFERMVQRYAPRK